jgi:hypothetical protein
MQELTISEQFYDQFLQADVTMQFEPKYCITFAMPLPFQLPLKDGTCFLSVFENLATAFILDKYETVSHEATFPKSPLQMAQMRSRVEMVVLYPEVGQSTEIRGKDEIDEHAYEFLIRHLFHLTKRFNNYVYAYRMLFEDCRAHSISPEQYFQVYVRTISLPEWSVDLSEPLVVSALPQNYENILFNMPDEFVAPIEALGNYTDQASNGFVASSHFFADARRYLYKIQPREAVLFLGLCSESLLNGLFRHIRTAAGKSRQEVECEFDEIPFMRRIKRHISHSLGGDWDMSSSKSKAGVWKEHVYELRNRVVHGGYNPDMSEAMLAFTTVIDFSEFIRERVTLCKSALPEAYTEFSSLPPLFLHGEELTTFDVS